MAKPCRNSRWLGPPRKLDVPGTNGIIERPFELLPDYGRVSLDPPVINGYDTSSQDYQVHLGFPVYSPERRRELTDSNSPACPLSRFISNAKARARLSRAAYAAYGREDHCCADHSFALLGPSSVGKTTLARLFGETLFPEKYFVKKPDEKKPKIPCIEVQPRSIRDARDLFMLIRNHLEETVVNLPDGPASLKMVLTFEDTIWRVPPCVVFIDEVHALPKNIIPELLKAVEPKDGMMVVDEGTEVDCRRVCWIIATTERGLLFPAFDNRFRKIRLDMYGREEIAAIVGLNHPTWNPAACRLVARYCRRVPREALAFAADVEMELEQHGGSNRVQTAARVARSWGIDRFGLTRQRLNVLVALGQLGPIGKRRTCDFAQCGLEELETYVMPDLLACTAAVSAMVVVGARGYQITRRGIRALEQRGIPHRGAEVAAEGIHRLDFGSYDPDNFGG
jgi:Holliday junction resolvasome RuvABC ATP-dependent DNA helicase subunit